MAKPIKQLRSIDTTAINEVDPAAVKEAVQGLAGQFPSTQVEVQKTVRKTTEKDVTLTLKIPEYVARELKIKSATVGKTQREIVLEGLKLWGIDVREEDIADRRKT